MRSRTGKRSTRPQSFLLAKSPHSWTNYPSMLVYKVQFLNSKFLRCGRLTQWRGCCLSISHRLREKNGPLVLSYIWLVLYASLFLYGKGCDRQSPILRGDCLSFEMGLHREDFRICCARWSSPLLNYTTICWPELSSEREWGIED